MHRHTARPGQDGQHHVHAPCGRRIAGPFPSAAAAHRHASALNRDRWLLALIERSERSRSPWDAYARFFRHTGDGRSAEQQLLDWWLALPDRAYTRTRAHVRVFDITGREWNLLAPGDARGVLDPLKREPADPTLAVSFAPHAIREHFEGTDRQQQARRLPDGTLEAAARDVVFTNDRLSALFDALCLDVLDRAAAEAAGGQG
jgi:hypothetical protein